MNDGEGEEELVLVGDLGYSGLMFFMMVDGKFFIKLLLWVFEYEFFIWDLFFLYFEYMVNELQSFFVWIMDLVYSFYLFFGGFFGFVLMYYIVMENFLYGKERVEEGIENGEGFVSGWEIYDFKLSDYFFFERDFVDGKFVFESVKDKLIDEFFDKI